jgi:hypothetical protein
MLLSRARGSAPFVVALGGSGAIDRRASYRQTYRSAAPSRRLAPPRRLKRAACLPFLHAGRIVYAPYTRRLPLISKLRKNAAALHVAGQRGRS